MKSKEKLEYKDAKYIPKKVHLPGKEQNVSVCNPDHRNYNTKIEIPFNDGCNKGKFHRTCLRFTIITCIIGSISGFCLIISRGVDHTIHESLPYIGLISFIVCLTLLVKLCATYGYGETHLLLEINSCQCHFPVQKSGHNQVILCNEEELATIKKGLEMHIHHNSDSNSMCKVKNCECRIATKWSTRIPNGSNFEQHLTLPSSPMSRDTEFCFQNSRNPPAIMLEGPCQTINDIHLQVALTRDLFRVEDLQLQKGYMPVGTPAREYS